MSLEAAMKEMAEAIKENTAVQANILQMMKGAKGGAAAGAAAEKTKPAAAGKAKKMTLDEFKAKFGDYLGVEDKKEREKRKANVTAIVEHFGTDRASNIEEEHWAEALRHLKAFESGEKPDFMSEEGGDDGDGDALV